MTKKWSPHRKYAALLFSVFLVGPITACSTGVPSFEETESSEEAEEVAPGAISPGRPSPLPSTEGPVPLDGDILFGPAGGVARNCSSSLLGTLSPVLTTELFDPSTGNFVALSLPGTPENQELQRIIGCAPTSRGGQSAVAVSYLTQERVTGLAPSRYLLNVALYEPGDPTAVQVGVVDLGPEFHYSSLRSYGDVVAVELPEEVLFLDSEELNTLWRLTGDDARAISEQGLDSLANNYQYVLIRNQELRDPRTGEIVMENVEANFQGLFYQQNGAWFLLTPRGEFKELPDSLGPFVSAISLEHVDASLSGDFLVFTGLKFAAIDLSTMEIPVLMDYDEFEATDIRRTRVGRDGVVYFSGKFEDTCSMITLPSLEDEEVACSTPVSTRDLADGWSVVYNDGLLDFTAYVQR